jgi:hypothetical protein
MVVARPPASFAHGHLRASRPCDKFTAINGNHAKARFVPGCAVNACFLIDLIPFNGTTG